MGRSSNFNSQSRFLLFSRSLRFHDYTLVCVLHAGPMNSKDQLAKGSFFIRLRALTPPISSPTAERRTDASIAPDLHAGLEDGEDEDGGDGGRDC